MIAKCKCEHDFQDAKHGKYMRVFNKGIKAYTCTVCGNKISAGGAEKKDK